MKRRKPRSDGGDRRRVAILVASLSAVVVLMSFCVVDFSGGRVDPSPSKARADQCQATCNRRIHKAALETSTNYSPPRSNSYPIPSVLPNTTISPLSLNRPRRLPTLIKVLTGFHDNLAPTAYPSVTPREGIIIAHQPKPQFPTPTNSVQQVAISAAYSVWKQRQSYHVDSLGGMKRIHQEWEEALKWIASWDEAALLLQQQQGAQMTGQQGLGWIEEGKMLQASYSNILDDKREDLTAFVNDLARLLQGCIDTCLADEEFDISLEDSESDEKMALGNSISRSLFSWAVGKSFSLSFRIRVDKDVMILIAGAIRLVASSVAVYATYCIWNEVSPILLQWYDSFVRRDDSSPAWLIEHEKELEMAKKRQRKGSSKKSKRKGSNSKPSQQQSGKLKANAAEESAKAAPSSTLRKTNLYPDHDDATAPPETDEQDSSNHWEIKYYNHSQKYSDKEDSAAPLTKVENDKNDERDDHLDGVPSSISISLSSTDNTDDRNQSDSVTLDEPTPQTTLHSNHLFHRQPHMVHSPTRKPLLVPTEEQRNEAAKQLREFQNAQIQRLLYRKKLAQSFAGTSVSSSISATPATPASQLHSSRSLTSPKVLKPPPGFNYPLDVQSNQDTQDDTFLTDNELILSKLLDDDEDDDNMDNLSSNSGMDSFPQESSLDPSAAPFVLEGLSNSKESVPTSPQAGNDLCDSRWDNGRSSSLSMSENGHNILMKGVYGGSVW